MTPRTAKTDTDMEFDSMYLLMKNYLRDQIDSVALVPIAHLYRNPGRIPEVIAEYVDEQTDLVAFSHVCYTNGLRLPVEETIRRVREKNPDCIILIDGAHAVGQLNLNFDLLDCDFYVMSAHKWLLAPPAMGFLWMNPRRSKLTNLTFLDFNWCDSFAVPEDLMPVWLRALSLSDRTSLELGSVDGAARYAASTAIQYLLAQQGDIEQRVLGQAYFAKCQIQSARNLTLHHSPIQGYDSGIVSFTITKRRGIAVLRHIVAQAAEQQVHLDLVGRPKVEILKQWQFPPLRCTNNEVNLRLCTHYDTESSVIENAIECLTNIVEYCTSSQAAR